MKNYERGELAKQILVGLAIGGFVVACFVLPGFAQIASLFKPKNSYDKRRVYQALKRLEKEKLVRVYVKNGNNVVEITKRGKKKVLTYKLEEIKLCVPPRWDEKWYLVMFDIPHAKKRARDAISFRIREMGLYPLQKSVFVSPYPCKDEIDFIGEVFNVKKYIIYIVATEIEHVEKVKRYFNL